MIGDMRVASELSWLFSVGVSAFERSALGGMLERAERTSLPKETLSPEHKLAAAWGHVRGDRPDNVLTAQPTKGTWYEPSCEPDETALLKFGDLSRRFREVMRRDPLAARALAAAYGPVGARVERVRSEHGVVLALLPLVPVGISLLEDARKAFAEDGTEITEPELLHALVEADAARERSTGRMARALAEATELLSGAIEMWLGAV